MTELTNIQKGLYATSVVGLLAAGGVYLEGPQGFALIALALGWLAACAAVTLSEERMGTLITAVGCAIAAGYLFSLKFAAAHAGPALCTINSVIDCDKVNSSPWSLAFGVPITLFGLGYYVGLAVAAVLADESRSKLLLQVSGLFAIGNVLYSLFLGSMSVAEGAICIVCLSMYAGNAMLLWAAIRGLRRRGGSLFDGVADAPFTREFVVIAGVFVLVLGVGYDQWRKVSHTVAVAADGRVPDDVLAAMYEQSPEVPLDGTEPVRGDPNAKIQIVEFADYACPHCAEAAEVMPGILDKFPEANLRFKVFPLTRECAASDQLPEANYPLRCDAAYAAECAKRQGRFWEMEKQLFENQGYFEADQLRMMAQAVGLDAATFDTCMASPTTKDAVKTSSHHGNVAGVHGTPTFYLKGVDPSGAWVRWRKAPAQIETLLTAIRAGQKMPPAPPAVPEE